MVKWFHRLGSSCSHRTIFQALLCSAGFWYRTSWAPRTSPCRPLCSPLLACMARFGAPSFFEKDPRHMYIKCIAIKIRKSHICEHYLPSFVEFCPKMLLHGVIINEITPFFVRQSLIKNLIFKYNLRFSPWAHYFYEYKTQKWPING